MKLPSLFKTSESSSPSSPWPWPLPTCGNYPKTLSFRAENHDNIFKTLNSTYQHFNESGYSLELCSEYSESSFSNTTITDVSELISNNDIETVIKGLKLEKERLFFEPEASKNINDIDNEDSISDTFDVPIFKESVVMALDSKDPFVDFKRSMEEMVEAHEIQDWECLEDLLTCYLKVNCKSNHGYIVGAFVDLLVSLAFTQDNDSGASTSSKVNIASHEEHCLSTSTTSHSFTSPLSFCSTSTSLSTSLSTASTSTCLSLLEEGEDDDIIIHKTIDNSVPYPQ